MVFSNALPSRLSTPPYFPAQSFCDAAQAVKRVREIYEANTAYVRNHFEALTANKEIPDKVSANYPRIVINVERKDLHRHEIDRRLSHGFVSYPGRYEETLTRPDLFGPYYEEQLDMLIRHHGVPVEVGVSKIPIPIYYAFSEGIYLEQKLGPGQLRLMQESFDLPDMLKMRDGRYFPLAEDPYPLALFNAPRVDLAFQRLRHYTGTSPANFQNFVIFTNYAFYVKAFKQLAAEIMSPTDDSAAKVYRSQYIRFVEPGDFTTYNRNNRNQENTGNSTPPFAQMPAYHLVRKDGNGITLIDIGVGPSNAKNIADNVAVLRPHAWIMLGHCAGLRPELELGDYILANAYERNDGFLNDILPANVPVPELAEVRQALTAAVEEVTGRTGNDVREIMRTGTVITTSDRNWENWDFRQTMQKINMSRAIALDMESGVIASIGYLSCVPYGTLLCVSDKPLQGISKLPGMADAFYKQNTSPHLLAGIRAMERLRENPNLLHSRKLSPILGRVFL